MPSRRRADGTHEIRLKCHICVKRTLDYNPERDAWKCWRCGVTGRGTPSTWRGDKLPKQPKWMAVPEKPKSELDLHTELPDVAVQFLKQRGFDPTDLTRRFGLLWETTYQRIAWPAGEGCYSLRGVHPWQKPKTLTKCSPGVPKGFILDRTADDQHIVLVEGDFKAAALPRPWSPWALMGTALTPHQEAILRVARPKTVTILLDGGFEKESSHIQARLWGMDSRVLSLPDDCGPDDIPRSQLVQLLLGTE